jgi:hypothetical protein
MPVQLQPASVGGRAAGAATSLDCGDTSPLSAGETCLPVPKRGHARALQVSHFSRLETTLTRRHCRTAGRQRDGSLAAHKLFLCVAVNDHPRPLFQILKPHDLLKHEFYRLNMTEVEGVNLLANQLIISDNVIWAHEIAPSDAARAIAYLRTLMPAKV